MRKRGLILATLGLVALLVAGGLYASNMGFKLNYVLDGPGTGGSLTGTSTMALPYNQQLGHNDALTVFGDLPAEATAIGTFVKSSGGVDAYTGLAGSINFPIEAGVGYFVTVNADTNYIIVGSHKPSWSVTFDGPGTGGSLTGTSMYAYPYHSVAAFAKDLQAEMNLYIGDPGRVSAVGTFVKSSGGVDSYTGLAGSINFPLVPGEAYFITVTADSTYVPAHY